ncbi:MAG TPA: NADH:flavin oxidoreductase [Blastocatellia bacterium]|nr:NADH:flavin oxidoreductase [Blastocatellia bacterium]
MSPKTFLHIGSVRDPQSFRRYLREHNIAIPCDDQIESGVGAPLAQPITVDGRLIGNRFAIQPMEGWDGTPDGRPGELTFRRWQNFGRSGAKLIWGAEAVAVLHEGRANPNQLLISDQTRAGLAALKDRLIDEHQRATGSRAGLIVGLQLTHSGRYSTPNRKGQPEPRIVYHHPILDQKLGLDRDHPTISDGDVRQIIEAFHRAARIASEIGFDFVDIKHCHGYLGHEFLSAHTREGDYGGSFENRTRFLREIVQGIRSISPSLGIGVRLSAFDTVPYRPDPEQSTPGKPGPGVPEEFKRLLPYRWGFGVDPQNPLEPDLEEPRKFLRLLAELGIRMVNISAGSPYYNPHIQRPAFFPPSDGYQPPEDPLAGVARQMSVTRILKQEFPALMFVGTGYTYLQDFVANVAQAAVRDGWVDVVGLGRMVLVYPELPLQVLEGRTLERKRLCRTFSDCTTAPRNGLPSGCYPLDRFYKDSQMGFELEALKRVHRKNTAESEP